MDILTSITRLVVILKSHLISFMNEGAIIILQKIRNMSVLNSLRCLIILVILTIEEVIYLKIFIKNLLMTLKYIIRSLLRGKFYNYSKARYIERKLYYIKNILRVH